MKRIHAYCIILSIAGFVLSSCNTTGDPTQGGIFWSAEKAKERQRVMLTAMNESQTQVDMLEAKQYKLAQERARLQSEIQQLRNMSSQSLDPATLKELNNRISELENQLNDLSGI